ncbi:MAG: Holliday junction resolvase RuvX [Dehalococcoidia bacterium]
MRWLGIDAGTVHVGLAISDAEEHIVVPLEIVPANVAFPAIRAIVLRENIQGIVVGLPLLPSGDEGYSVKVARKLGSKLEVDLGIAVYYEDETLTTEAVLSREPNINKKHKRRNDDLAATLILDQFLQKRRIDNIQIDTGDKKC